MACIALTRSRVRVALIVSCSVMAAACAAEPARPSARVLPPRFFSARSAWNTPIRHKPVLDPQSRRLVPLLTRKPAAQIYADSVHIFYANGKTRRQKVVCTQPWGRCPLSVRPVPIPPKLKASTGLDHAIIIVDRSTNLEYDLWKATYRNGRWTAAWGAVERVGSSGDGRGGLYGGSGGVGAGVAGLAGLVTLAELKSGVINHALGFASTHSCPTFRYPATKSDGHRPRPCLDEGARIQLDPTINIDAIHGITPFEKVVGHALQTYGAYNKDVGGSSLGIGFESPGPSPNPYPALGVPGDYWRMPHIPWASLRVLRRWDGR